MPCQRRPHLEGVNFTLEYGGRFLLKKPSFIHDGQFTIDFAPVFKRHSPFFVASKVGVILKKKTQKLKYDTIFYTPNKEIFLCQLY